MNSNKKPSEAAAVLAVMNPVSQVAATVTSAWVNMAGISALLAVLQTGVMGASGTIDAKLQQAQDGSGTGAKDITGKAITQLVKASNDNDQVLINCRTDALDITGGFTHVRLSVTVGVAASLISAVLLGFYGRSLPVTQGAAVVETVG